MNGTADIIEPVVIPCRLSLARSDKQGQKVVRLGFIKIIDVQRECLRRLLDDPRERLPCS